MTEVGLGDHSTVDRAMQDAHETCLGSLTHIVKLTMSAIVNLDVARPPREAALAPGADNCRTTRIVKARGRAVWTRPIDTRSAPSTGK
jgi:hypothetical protein